MKRRIVLPRREDRRISYVFGPPFPSEVGWVWLDRRAKLERRVRHSGIERRVRRREEALFRTLFEVALDAAVLLDVRGAVVIANRQCERMLGYQRDELLGQMIETLLPEAYRSAYSAARDRYLRQPYPTRLELALKRCDTSELPVEVSLSPIETLQRQLVYAVARDLTEQHEAIARLERKVEALAEAEPKLGLANEARSRRQG